MKSVKCYHINKPANELRFGILKHFQLFLLFWVLLCLGILLVPIAHGQKVNDLKTIHPRNPETFFQILMKRQLLSPFDYQTITSPQSLNINDTQTAQALAQSLVGVGVTISNVTFTGATRSRGTFSGGTGIIGFESGVVLSSGDIRNIIGPNDSTSATANNQTPGDTALSGIAGGPTFDAAVLQFNFVPNTNVISFQYVFGSEEYNEFANSTLNDVFALFVNGTNVALIPGTTTPISINTVNGGNPLGTNPQNQQFYRNNDFQNGTAPINTQVDGLTVVINAQATVIPGQTNTIRLAIADTGDDSYDSAVLIRSGSIASLPATTLSVAPASGISGGTTNLSATLRTTNNTPIAGKTINFLLNGTPVGNAVTNSSGVALLNNASLAGIAPNTYPNGVEANFAGDTTFNGSSGNNSLTVTQSCTYSFNPTGSTIPANGGSFSFTVITNSGCPISPSSNVSWLTPSNSSGSNIVNYTVEANPTTFQRTGIISVGGQNFNVTQDALTCQITLINLGQSINGNLSANSCNINGAQTDIYTFAGTVGQQIVISMDALGTSGVQPLLRLISTDGSTILQGSSGDRNARIPTNGFYTLPATGTYSIRASSFGGLGDYVLSLIQQPATACNYSLSSAMTNVPPSGGTFFFDVVTGPNCPTVSATYNIENPWLRIISNTGGRVTFTAAPYTGATDRTELITVAGQTHTVRQFGVSPPTNDAFSQAQILPGSSGLIMGRNTNATAEANEPAHAGSPASRSVWYRWTAPSDGLYSFTTSGSSFDTVMAIYTGSSVGGLTQIASNDNTTSFDQTSKINFRATAGTVYSIAVDGKNGATGSIQLGYSRYRRLFRLYLQNFNGFASPITPTSVVARRQDGTGTPINGTPVSLGVYEFDLPEDNSIYEVTIAGPAGITWQPSVYIINNSNSAFNELMEGGGQTGNGQNQTSNATNTIPRKFKGYIHGISTQTDLAALQIKISSPGSNSSVSPKDCAAPNNPNPILVSGGPNGTMRVLYECTSQPNTEHRIIPSASNKAFTVSVLPLPVLDRDTGPSSSAAYLITATTAPTFNISGRVLANGQGLSGATIDISSGNMNAQTTSDANGNYVFPNLAPGLTYTLQAARNGFIFQPQTVTLQAPGATLDISAQSCSYSFSGNGNFGANGGNGEFSVTATTNQGCQWTATNGVNSEWITINSGSSVGNGLVQFNVQPNIGVERTGTIRVGGQNFTVTQSNGCTYAFSANNPSFPAAGGTGSFIVTPSSNGCNWTPMQSDYCMVNLTGGGTGGGTVSYTVGNNTGVSRTATIKIGEQLFTINQEAAPGIHRTRYDFDGDGRADIAVFRPSNALWFIQTATQGTLIQQFGIPGDVPQAGDYDGDGKTDLAIFRPNGTTGSEWWINRSGGGGVFAAQFGTPTDKPIAADYTGDGKTDIAFWRPSTGQWFVLRSEDFSFYSAPFGLSTDIPAPGDFDGDGKADLAVFRPSTGVWYRQLSSSGQFDTTQFGLSGDIPVVADYDGDGKADIAVYRPSNNIWYRLNSSNGQFTPYQFGSSGDVPVPADYNGDKRADIATYRPSAGTWLVWTCQINSLFAGTRFGLDTDIPIPIRSMP